MGQYACALGGKLMNTAFLFPGQASQKIGMGLDLFQRSELGKKYYDLANDILDCDIQDISFNGPEEILEQTKYTQPAIYVVSVILGKLLLDKGFTPTVAAGHSLGEYSALTIGGAFNFRTGLKLVKCRAESMQTAGEIQNGTMAAIIGLSDDEIKSICGSCSNGNVVVPANYNSPGQVVISGEVSAVHLAMNKATEAGARNVIKLNVSGAFHSPLMTPAREALAEILNSIEIRDTIIPVYLNVSAKPVTKRSDIRNGLISQLEKSVLWHKTITTMNKNKINKYFEIGPGRVLQGLNRRINRTFQTTGIETLDDVIHCV